MTTAAPAAPAAFAPLAEIERATGLPHRRIKALAEAGRIRRRVMPGARTLYDLNDARRLVEASITGAGPDAA